MQMGGEAKPRPRWNQIEGLRAVAATCVFFWHIWLVLGGPVDRLVNGLGVGTVRFIAPYFEHSGQAGVALFYAISGFLLYQPFVRARAQGTELRLGAYFLRRAARIIPAYWGALIIIGLVTGNETVFTGKGFVNYFLFGQLFTTLHFSHLTHPMVAIDQGAYLTFTGNPVSVAWTLCVEVSFYIFLPVWAWLAAKATAKRVHPIRIETVLLAGLVLASLAYKVIVLTNVGSLGFEPLVMILPSSIDIFAAGMLLALLTARAQDSGWPKPLVTIARRPALCWLAAIGLFALMCLGQTLWNSYPAKSLFPISEDELKHWELGVWGVGNVLIASLLLIPAVVGDGVKTGVGRFLTSKVVAWIGLVSYGLYLWHVFVLEQVSKLFEQDVPPIALIPVVALACYVLTLGIAATSWYGLEKRVLAAAHRFGLQRARSAEPNQ